MPQNEDDLEALALDAILDPEPEDEPGPPATSKGHRKRRRLQRLPALPCDWTRVPIPWLTKPRKAYLCGPRERLYFLVVWKSHWGQKGVKLTTALTAEIGLSLWAARWHAARLARDGWVRLEYEGPSHATVVWPLVHTG
jgi:hypothetical protein